jgi:hypothetical protein
LAEMTLLSKLLLEPVTERPLVMGGILTTENRR